MNSSRVEWKVGVFVLVSLIVMGALMISFSRGSSIFKSSYDIYMRTRNVAGIKRDAGVLMAGVAVGNVVSADLAPDGKSVMVRLKILNRYKIHSDARFIIEQAGFLGDQYIAIIPQENKGAMLAAGAEVVCEEPFNLQEAARSAMGLISRVDHAVEQLHVMIDRVDKTLLSGETLTNLTETISNFRKSSERTLATIEGVNKVVQTNAPVIGATLQNIEVFSERLQAITNLVKFTEQLDKVALQLEATVKENRTDISAAVKNVEAATELASKLLQDLEQGRGLEFDALFTVPLQLAKQAGVRAPTLELLVALARKGAYAAEA